MKLHTCEVSHKWSFTKTSSTETRARKTYRNPVALALEWQKAIDSGHYLSQADVTQEKGVSHARVTQVLNLLRLAPRVIGIVMDLGDPLLAPMATERRLRRIINLPRQKQLKELAIILGGIQGGRELTRRS